MLIYRSQVNMYLNNNGITDYTKYNIREADEADPYIYWDYPINKPTVDELPSIGDANTWTEEQRQKEKSIVLKTVENKFLIFCDLLTSSSTHTKLGFDQLSNILESMQLTDPNTAIVLSVKLLAIDAEGKREGGLNWWDDCVWHPEIV